MSQSTAPIATAGVERFSLVILRDVRMWSLLVVSQLLFCGFYVGVTAFKDGGPPAICYSLYPKHRPHHPQTTPSPYAMEVSPSSYAPGHVIKLRLSSPSGVPFRGFQVRTTRDSGDTEGLVGEFVRLPKEAKALSWYPEHNQTQNCATHSSAEDKTEVILYWRAPPLSVGNVTITASFVYKYHEYWLTSNKVGVVATLPSEEPEFQGSISPDFPPIRYSDCGVTKGCLLYPRGCSGEDCQYIVTYSINLTHNTAVIEMRGTTPGYLCLALSRSKYMPKSHTMSCILNKEFPNGVIQNGHNPNYKNTLDRSFEFRGVQISRDADWLSCRFSRPLVMQSKHYHRKGAIDDMEYDIRDLAYIQLAWGTIWPGAPVMVKHVEIPVVSDNLVNFLENSMISGTSMNVALAAHAVVGGVAWMFLSSTFVITARYYRKAFHTDVIHVALWFQVHRAGLSAVSVLTLTCIVIMAVYLNSWTKYNSLHAACGAALMTLCACMALSGYLRPGLASKYRKYFNSLHRAAGCVTWILAVVTCALGPNADFILRSVWSSLSYVICVYIGFQIASFILFELLHTISVPKKMADTVIPSVNDALDAKPTPESDTNDILVVSEDGTDDARFVIEENSRGTNVVNENKDRHANSEATDKAHNTHVVNNSSVHVTIFLVYICVNVIFCFVFFYKVYYF